LQDLHTTNDVSEHEVRSELARLLQSPVFLQSDRLGRFLRFAIENALSGKTELLKEYVIGTEVYDRKPPYHPSQDSIVRTEARRLRAKLKEYYEGEGKLNPVFIYFRPGTYIPLFRRNESTPGSMSSSFSSGDDLLVKGAGVAVAVLPFLDLSNRSFSAQCARGITDEITHNLTRADGIRVIARASLPEGVNTSQDIPALSQKLAVNNIIEGTVREDFDRLRITVRVLGADGFQVSSHRFETIADTESLIRVQEQIATAFISRARPEQSRIRQRKAMPGGLMIGVYPLVLHAESLLDEGTTTDLPAALLKFQEAREFAPSFARPYCGISHCHMEMALRGAGPSSTLVSRAKEAALRAIELDPEMIESYSCLGGAQALEWDWAGAEKSFLQGLSLGTQVSSSRRYGLFLAAIGRFDEASHYLVMSQNIDPFSNRQKIAWTKFLYLTGRDEEGIRQLSTPLIYGPLPVEARFYLALMAARLGNSDQAKLLIEAIRAASGGQLSMMAGIAEVLALNGENDQAHHIVGGLKLLSLDAAISRFRQALLAMALGDSEAALSFLRLAVEDQEAELVWIGVDPRFDVIRQTNQFKELAAKVLPR
jgi:TolB-like protein/tetratricopeptide (TPR) repeat protein